MPVSSTTTRRATRVLVACVGVTVLTALVAPAADAAPSTTALTGTVRAVDGAPLAGVEVAVAAGGVDGVAGTTTAADGTYRVRAPRATDVQVQFGARSATGGTSATGYADRCAPSGAALCEPDGPALDLTGVAARRIDARLGRAAVLGGRVTDSLGRGVGGMPVVAVAVGVTPWNPLAGPAASTLTDVNGTWSFGRVDPISYRLAYGAPGYAPTPATPSPLGYSGASAGVDVPAGRVVTLAQTVRGGGELVGRVLDQAGVPVAGATVSVGARVLFELYTTSTDADGRFRIEDLPSGRFPVCVDAAGYTDPCDGPDGGQVTVRQFTPTTVTIAVRRIS